MVYLYCYFFHTLAKFFNQIKFRTFISGYVQWYYMFIKKNEIMSVASQLKPKFYILNIDLINPIKNR